MTFLSTALTAIVVFILFMPVATFLVMFFKLKSTVIRVQNIRVGGEDELSEAFRLQARHLSEKLESLGWRKSHVQLGTPAQEDAGRSEAWVFDRPGEATRAVVGWVRGGFSAPSVMFNTSFLGGVSLSTTSGHPYHELLPQGMYGVHRVASREPSVLLDHHQKRFEGAIAQGLAPSHFLPGDFCARLEAGQIKTSEQLIADGGARSERSGGMYLTWWFSLRHAFRVAFHRKAVLKTECSAGLTVQERSALRNWNPGSEVSALEVSVPTATPNRKKWNWTLASLLLFGVAEGFWLGWSFVPVFLAVLLFHEAGHVVAMRLFKYKDVNVFFVPFLGALATANGKPWGLAPWKRALVSIAGPLPGIVLGLVLIPIVMQTQFMAATLWPAILTLLGLNLFNLLPLGDMDGGQFLQATLLSRFPRAEVFFRLAGSAGLVAIALYLKLPLVTAFAALPLLTLRHHWESANLRIALRRQAKVVGLPTDQSQAVGRVDELMRTSPFDAIPEPRRGMVRQLVVRDLDPTPMPIWQSILSLGLFLLLWSPVILVFLGQWYWLLLGPKLLHRHGARH